MPCFFLTNSSWNSSSQLSLGWSPAKVEFTSLLMLVHNGSNCFTQLEWSVNKWAGAMLPDSLQYVQMVKHLPSEKQLGSPGSWSTSLHPSSKAVTLYSRFVRLGTDIQAVMANEGASQSFILLIHTMFLLQQVHFQLEFISSLNNRGFHKRKADPMWQF